MIVVIYYSLVADADGTRERQWARSVESLRRHNAHISVVLCLYGSARPETLATAGRFGVRVQPMGSFADAFGDVPRHWRNALATLPTLHKLLSLHSLVTADAIDRFIYLDCDTYFFDDVANLAMRYDRCDWYARESYPDEQALAEIAHHEGLVLVPAFNSGVMVLSGVLAHTLVTLLDDFVWYAWRLLLGICLWSPEVLGNPALAELVRARSSEGERRLALPYPSDNFWIMDEIATCLTLGRVPGLTHDLLRQDDVIQGDEYPEPSDTTIVVHYFSSRERQFLARIGYGL